MTKRALLAALLVLGGGCMTMGTPPDSGGPLLPPGGTAQPPPSTCGDGFCEASFGETTATCPIDCGFSEPAPTCGDGVCEADESCSSCPDDCGTCTAPVPVCENTPLQPQLLTLTGTTVGAAAQADTASCGDGETGPMQTYTWGATVAGVYVVSLSATFPAVLDVRHALCGGEDFACDASEQTNATQVTLPLTAGDLVQILVAGEGGASGTYQLQITQNADACGDGVCEAGESSDTCPADCGEPTPTSFCGDGVCDPGEDSVSCSGDCG
jgi:hypothetical protein